MLYTLHTQVNTNQQSKDPFWNRWIWESHPEDKILMEKMYGNVWLIKTTSPIFTIILQPTHSRFISFHVAHPFILFSIFLHVRLLSPHLLCTRWDSLSSTNVPSPPPLTLIPIIIRMIAVVVIVSTFPSSSPGFLSSRSSETILYASSSNNNHRNSMHV